MRALAFLAALAIAGVALWASSEAFEDVGGLVSHRAEAPPLEKPVVLVAVRPAGPEVRPVPAPEAIPPTNSDDEYRNRASDAIDVAIDATDRPERGHHRLTLRIFDEADRPVGSEAELWRIDAPPNEHWSHGDQMAARLTIPPAGKTKTLLPAGTYRLVLHGQRADVADPVSFVVRDRVEEHNFRLHRPTLVPVQLTVRDEQGALVRSGSLSGPRVESRKRLGAPRWALSRQPLTEAAEAHIEAAEGVRQACDWGGG